MLASDLDTITCMDPGYLSLPIVTAESELSAPILSPSAAPSPWPCEQGTMPPLSSMMPRLAEDCDSDDGTHHNSMTTLKVGL